MTIVLTPKLASAPLTRPHVKATNFGLASRYCLGAKCENKEWIKIKEKPVLRRLGKKFKGVVLEYVDALVIGPQVVNLFPEVTQESQFPFSFQSSLFLDFN